MICKVKNLNVIHNLNMVTINDVRKRLARENIIRKFKPKLRRSARDMDFAYMPTPRIPRRDWRALAATAVAEQRQNFRAIKASLRRDYGNIEEQMGDFYFIYGRNHTPESLWNLYRNGDITRSIYAQANWELPGTSEARVRVYV